MSTQSEVRSEIYAIIDDRFTCMDGSPGGPDELSFRKDLHADEGIMIVLFSDLSEKFGIEIHDFLGAYVPTVGALVEYILGRVPSEG
jgi:acyl carrier protein